MSQNQREIQHESQTMEAYEETFDTDLLSFVRNLSHTRKGNTQLSLQNCISLNIRV